MNLARSAGYIRSGVAGLRLGRRNIPTMVQHRPKPAAACRTHRALASRGRSCSAVARGVARDGAHGGASACRARWGMRGVMEGDEVQVCPAPPPRPRAGTCSAGAAHAGGLRLRAARAVDDARPRRGAVSLPGRHQGGPHGRRALAVTALIARGCGVVRVGRARQRLGRASCASAALQRTTLRSGSVRRQRGERARAHLSCWLARAAGARAAPGGGACARRPTGRASAGALWDADGMVKVRLGAPRRAARPTPG